MANCLPLVRRWRKRRNRCGDDKAEERGGSGRRPGDWGRRGIGGGGGDGKEIARVYLSHAWVGAVASQKAPAPLFIFFLEQEVGGRPPAGLQARKRGGLAGEGW